jgi:hypothetical protein
MNKYQDGKIYKLTSKQTDKIYVGSTIRTLDARMIQHKIQYKCGNSHNISSAEILKYDDCIIELIEDSPCDSKTELEKREQHYMDLYRDIIVNKHNTSQYCDHNKPRRYCVECKGVEICEHNKPRRDCIECKGCGICEHNCRRRTCVKCNGSSICEHNKHKSRCKECKGSQICEHNKIRYTCIECKGNGICEHLIVKRHCKICNNIKMCIAISISRDKKPCPFRAKPDSDYCGRHTPK